MVRSTAPINRKAPRRHRHRQMIVFIGIENLKAKGDDIEMPLPQSAYVRMQREYFDAHPTGWDAACRGNHVNRDARHERAFQSSSKPQKIT
jgi:hypothetical protein